MSDVMLLGVLEMPPSLWSGDPMDVAQRHSRYKQAAQRIRDDAEKIDRLRNDVALAKTIIDSERRKYRMPSDLERAVELIIDDMGEPFARKLIEELESKL